MRPAKSFWKNAQDWRTTCQWFCQRMRFDDVGGDRLVGDQVLRGHAPAAARPAAPRAMPSEHAARLSRTASSGWCRVISVTMRPMNTGMVESSSATTKPATNSADEQALRLAGEVPVEGDEAGRRLGLLRQIGRLQQPFEQRKHGTGSKRSATALRRHAWRRQSVRPLNSCLSDRRRRIEKLRVGTMTPHALTACFAVVALEPHCPGS